jgi:hypothetical protein
MKLLMLFAAGDGCAVDDPVAAMTIVESTAYTPKPNTSAPRASQ